jgi:hypothetical protein
MSDGKPHGEAANRSRVGDGEVEGGGGSILNGAAWVTFPRRRLFFATSSRATSGSAKHWKMVRRAEPTSNGLSTPIFSVRVIPVNRRDPTANRQDVPPRGSRTSQLGLPLLDELQKSHQYIGFDSSGH